MKTLELKGKMVSSKEIAEVLGVPKRKIEQAMNRLADRGVIKTSVITEKCPQRRTASILLVNIPDAKLVVAKYDNDRGISYLKYLIETETKYQALMLETVKLNNLLHQQLTALRDFEDMIQHGKTFTPKQQNYYNHLKLKLERTA